MTRLDIFSDPVCPWCLIGMANLERALQDAPAHLLEPHWHPFRLDPAIPAGGMDRQAWLRAKFPDPARLAAVHERLREVAAEAGITLDPDRPHIQPDTLDAHRLIYWAGIEGCQPRVVMAILRAFWEEGRDIGKGSTLADIASTCAMDRATVLRLLAGDADRDTVLTLESEARRRGVRSVPTFIIGQTHVASGAQPVGLWQELIASLAGEP